MHQRMAYVVNCHVPQKFSMTALLCFSPQFASKVTFLRAGLLRSSSAPVDCHVFGRPARVRGERRNFCQNVCFRGRLPSGSMSAVSRARSD